jgi:hypothetical protein
MTDLKDLFPSSQSMDAVVDRVQQRPGDKVTEVHDKSVEANIINQAEAAEQALASLATDRASALENVDKDYKFMIEGKDHKVIILPEQGLTYNYRATCSCHWSGHFMTVELAERTAHKHIIRAPHPVRR